MLHNAGQTQFFRIYVHTHLKTYYYLFCKYFNIPFDFYQNYEKMNKNMRDKVWIFSYLQILQCAKDSIKIYCIYSIFCISNQCIFKQNSRIYLHLHLIIKSYTKIYFFNSDKYDDHNIFIRIEPLCLTLNEAGPVTLALAALFKDMHTVGKTGAINPGHLFGQVCKRSPQFRGFQQQDAHELLRHLLDSLRSEEVKRQKSAILKNFGLTEKTDPKTVNSNMKKKLQALGRHSNYTLMDKIFGGQLVSTIVCENCHNSSQIYEPFLDLREQFKKSVVKTKFKNHDLTNFFGI